MLSWHLDSWQKGIDSREPVSRFLKSYAAFITDHTGKEDKFFDLVEENSILSKEGECYVDSALWKLSQANWWQDKNWANDKIDSLFGK